MEAQFQSLCKFEPTEDVNSDGWRKHRCTRCGYVSVYIPPWSERIIRPNCSYVGIGDRVAHCLAAFGITKERVAWVREQFGLPGCGGCPEKQEALNEAGKKIGL